MISHRPRVPPALSLLLALGTGCSDGVNLEVVAHTDLPKDAVASVQVDVGTAPFETFRERVQYDPSPSDDFLTGVEVASFATVPEDDYFVTVELRDPADQVVAAREMIVRLDTNRELIVAVDRACTETLCPATDGPADRTSCSGGRCVNPFCSSAFREACESSCETAADCEAGPPCRETQCVEGVCLTSDRGC